MTDHEAAKLAHASYSTRERIEAMYGSNASVFRSRNARALCVELADSVWVAFTGTDDLADVRADIRGKLVSWSGSGLVHTGFLAYLMQVWDRVRTYLLNTGKPASFTGHSLGAGAATIAAVDWVNSGLTLDRLVTFGSPRVGDTEFAAAVDLSVNHQRYVCCSDVVTRIPRLSLRPLTRYRHSGRLIYLGCDGQHRYNPSNWALVWDRLTGRFKGVLSAVLRGVTDHSMSGYVRRV